jgi:hypothetical protein
MNVTSLAASGTSHGKVSRELLLAGEEPGELAGAERCAPV